MAGKSFCVIGAGVTGMSSAYCIAKRFQNCEVTIVFDKESPDTTSNHGFGLCSIRTYNELDGANTVRWAQETGKYCADVFRRSPEISAEMGIIKVDDYLLWEKQPSSDVLRNEPSWKTWRYSQYAPEEAMKVMGFRMEDLGCVFERQNVEKDNLGITKAGSWVIDNHSYLPWLKKELHLMKVRGEISEVQFIQRRLNHFDEVFDNGRKFDCIINCSGLGAEYLVPDDKMVPIRGQYVCLEPKEKLTCVHAYHTFICPKPGRVAIGNFHQKHRRDMKLDPNATRELLQKSAALYPKIRDWKIIGEGVAIRPGRIGGPRVELEFRYFQSQKKMLPIVHNYGHGAHGIVQHWGCAKDVMKLAVEAFDQSSKL